MKDEDFKDFEFVKIESGIPLTVVILSAEKTTSMYTNEKTEKTETKPALDVLTDKGHLKTSSPSLIALLKPFILKRYETGIPVTVTIHKTGERWTTKYKVTEVKSKTTEEPKSAEMESGA